jgi:similar to stage IV sporulation protein
MNRRILNYFEGIIVIHVKGRNIERFLSYLYKQKICITDTRYIDRQNVLIKIFNRDLDKVMNIKTSCDVTVEKYEGKLRLREGIKNHLILIISLVIGYLFLLFISNIIFDVEVIHSNTNIRKLVTEELKERNISKWHFKQSYEGIKKIKEEILSEYKDRLEWIEIESIGTKYIVKVEERKIIEKDKEYIYQDIVSSKSAVIVRINATEGEIIRQKNDYVKKGDIIISGKIMKGNEVSKLVKASGKIYGEVWYNIKVEHPLIYQSKISTGKEKKVYKIVFLNHSLSLFNFHPFKDKITKDINIVKSPLVPFKIVKELQNEVTIKDEIYTDGEALIKAEEQAIKKMQDYLSEDEYIISKRKLKYYVENQKLYLDMFFKVYENIGVARAITE